MTIKPPVRLLDDPGAPSGLRANLQRVRAADQGYDAARGLSRLQSALQLPAAGPAPAPAAGLAASKLLWLGALGAVVVAGTTVVLVREPSARAPRERVAAQMQRSQPAPDRELAAHAREPVVPTPGRDAAPPLARDPGSAMAGPDSVRREIEQLAQIRALLPRDPAAAHALAQRSAHEFPAGALREEREALSALALARLGKHGEARQAARAFVLRYPHSPLRAALEPLLSEPR